MHTLTLRPYARQLLASQVTQNGTFELVLVSAAYPSVRTIATLFIEQCHRGISLEVKMGESRHSMSITLAKGEDAGKRAAAFVEDVANGICPSSVAVVDEHLLVTDTEKTLRVAIRRQCGTYELAQDETGLESLCLVLQPSISAPRRAAFYFELDFVKLTLPLRLPTDRELAYDLLSGCVQELAANYRIAH